LATMTTRNTVAWSFPYAISNRADGRPSQLPQMVVPVSARNFHLDPK
jgi:hypothetical protein